MASFGSTISVISAFLFFFIVWEALYSASPMRCFFDKISLSCYPIKKLSQLITYSVSINIKPKPLGCPVKFLENKFRIVLINRNKKNKDAARAWQINFQDPVTSVMEGIIDLHHDIMIILIFVVSFIVWLLCIIISKFSVVGSDVYSLYRRNKVLSVTIHNTYLEII